MKPQKILIICAFSVIIILLAIDSGLEYLLLLFILLAVLMINKGRKEKKDEFKYEYSGMS